MSVLYALCICGVMSVFGDECEAVWGKMQEAFCQGFYRVGVSEGSGIYEVTGWEL